MKRILSLLIFSSLLIIGAVRADAASIWTKYVSADKSYSLHYPSGWEVTANDSIVMVANSETDEQLIMSILPFDKLSSAQELAKEFIDLLKTDNPYVRASNWRDITEGTNDQVIFDLTDKNDGKAYSGLGIVIKMNQQAIWFSYFSQEADYYLIRSNYILQGFIESIATGTTSKAPSINYNVNLENRNDSNAKSFMFVLEFALGAPLTKSQEDTITKELKDGWRYRSEEELKTYDQYPALEKTILKMKQKDLDKLRTELEKTIREWLDETDKSDKAVDLINKTLKSRGKVVIKGDPPLTAMSLTAYSEIIAYSRLLQDDPEAKPDQITTKSVNEIKKQVKEVWGTFSENDKKDIATSPGLWVCLRVQLEYGSKETQNSIRDNLIKLGSTTGSIGPVTDNSNHNETKSDMDMTSHSCMMQIQQMTFNNYMWSRGFNYLPATGKMW